MPISDRIRRHIRSNLIGYVALFAVFAGGTAYATHGEPNSISTVDIINGEVKGADIGVGAVNGGRIAANAVYEPKVLNNSLTAADLAQNSVRSNEIREPLALGGTFDDVVNPPPTVPAQTLEVANAGSGAAIRVPDAGNYGIHLNNVGTDGIRVLEAGDDGIQIGSDPEYPSYGVYTPSPGVPVYALWPNTSDAAGEWALFTVDKIEAGNVAASSMSIVAKATGDEPLRAGDIASPTGVTDPIPGATSRLSTVRRAGASNPAVGVVEGRMVLEPGPGKKDVGMRSAPGPARSGDYVALTTLGVAEVRVAAGSAIAAGERLAASAGAARALRTARVDGIEVAEGAPTIGIALAEPDSSTGTVPVFVRPG